MSISLKVVRNAAVSCDSLRRRAVARRARDILTRVTPEISGASAPPADATGVGAGFGAAFGAAGVGAGVGVDACVAAGSGVAAAGSAPPAGASVDTKHTAQGQPRFSRGVVRRKIRFSFLKR